MPFWQRLLVLLASIVGVSFIAGLIWRELFGFHLPSYVSGVIGGLAAVLIWDLLKKTKRK